jgi:hypothetical protein
MKGNSVKDPVAAFFFLHMLLYLSWGPGVAVEKEKRKASLQVN